MGQNLEGCHAYFPKTVTQKQSKEPLTVFYNRDVNRGRAGDCLDGHLLQAGVQLQAKVLLY